jgi:hypothetical protein
MSALDVYALACLADGPVRAVDTAVVTLLLDGRLRAEPTGALGTAALRYDHPVEAAVLDAVGRRALRSIGTVRFRAAADDRLTGLVAELAVSGLLRRVRRPPLLRRGRPGWVLTDAGRSALREARRAGDDRVPARVALDGLDALPDQDLRRRVFDLPPDPRRIGGGYLDLRRAQAEMEGKGLIGEGGGGNWMGGGGGGP